MFGENVPLVVVLITARNPHTAPTAEQEWMVNDMGKKLSPVIVGKAYPVVCGNGWRCFDGNKWHDCDSCGNIVKGR